MTNSARSAADAAVLREGGPELLSLALIDARNRTLQLMDQQEQALASAGLAVPPEHGLELAQWVAGHIAWFGEFWIARNPRRHLGRACPPEAPRLASIEPLSDHYYDPSLAPHALRWQLELPGLQACRDYLLATLEATLELLNTAGEGHEDLFFFRAALFYEDWWAERILRQCQRLGLPLESARPAAHVARDPLLVPATGWQLGTTGAGFARDVERGRQEVQVPEFEIDAQPVSWAQFVEFVDDAGYDRAQLWHPDGWAWLQGGDGQEARRAPGHVEQIGGPGRAVLQSWFGRSLRVAGQQPALHLAWWEADAWARWAGRRLPAEVEWEVAAHHAASQGFSWGQVHEWTAGTLRPWKGFTTDAWTRHGPLEAEPCFGQARVQRGASFATPGRLVHLRARAFAMPGDDDGFVGFRTCAV